MVLNIRAIRQFLNLLSEHKNFFLYNSLHSVTSQHTTPHHITSHHTRHITSHHITSHHITSHHITSHHITSHHITSHHITSHHTTPHHTTPHHTTPHHTSHHITSHHINANLKSYYLIIFSLGKTMESLMCWNYYWTVVAIFYRLFKLEFLNESERIDETISCFDVATVIMMIKMLLKSLDDWLVAFEVCSLHFDGQTCSQRCTANFNRNFKPQRPWTIANDKVSEVIQSVLLQQLIFS